EGRRRGVVEGAAIGPANGSAGGRDDNGFTHGGSLMGSGVEGGRTGFSLRHGWSNQPDIPEPRQVSGGPEATDHLLMKVITVPGFDAGYWPVFEGQIGASITIRGPVALSLSQGAA